MSSLSASVLNWIGAGEDTVLVVSLVVGSSRSSRLSLLWLGLSSALEVTLSTLDVLESLSETILDGHDLCRGLVEEVVDLRLHFRVGLVVIFLELDLRDSLLNLSDQVAEPLLSRLALLVGVDLLGLLGQFLLLSLLNCHFLFLDRGLSRLLLASHLVDVCGHLVELLVEDLDDLLLVVLVDELKETGGHGLRRLSWKLLDRVIDVLCLECFLELVDDVLASQDGLDLFGVFLWDLLAVLVLFGLVDGVEGNAEVAQEAVNSDDPLLLGIGGSSILLGCSVRLVEFGQHVGELRLESLVLLQSAAEGSSLGLELPEVARQLLVGRSSRHLVIVVDDLVGLRRLGGLFCDLGHVVNF